jgi:hypothetical protein
MELQNLPEHIRLEDYQQQIYEGLKQIGEEMAIFYLDGIRTYQREMPTRPYLLAHIAREIECGLRDIFASDVKQKKDKCPACGREKEKSTHIDEICAVIQVDPKNEFAKNWHKLARKFHKYAHRQGPWRKPRGREEFDVLWVEFEKNILNRLVGGYLNLISLVDKLLDMVEPTEEVLGTLDNLLQNEARRYYFFKNLKHIKWFPFLKKYFSPEKAPSPQPAEEEGYFIIPQWNVLPYLEKISQQVTITDNEKYAEELLDIIKNVTEYHVKNDRRLDNYRTWWYFVKILLNIPNAKIIKYLKDNNIQIGKDWIKEWITSKFDSLLPASDISTKLLPKFLTENKEDIEIAEQIIDVITDIKEDYFEDEEETQRIGLFEGKKEPKTKVDSYWLIESFKKNADKIGKLCSDTLIFGLANKLKMILDREHNDYQVLIELDDNTYRITTTRIGEYNFKFSIERLHKKEIDNLKPEDRHFGVLKVAGETLHSFSKSNIQKKERFIRIIKEEIENNPSISVLKNYPELDKKLKSLYEGLYSDYSSIWYKSLSAGPDSGIHNAQELLVFILRDILFSKCAMDTFAGRVILDRFLSDEYQYPLFRRFVLLVVGAYWNEYKNLFWKFIKVVTEPFDESDYEVELYKLLQQNITKFTPDEKDRIKNLISKGPRWLPDEKERQKQYIARWKQKWYSAMQEDDYFLKLFEEQKTITGEEKIESPSEKVFIETRWGPGPSPLSKEEILKMNNVDLVKYLRKFKTQDRWKGPTEEGLAEVLRSAVKENPNKFVEELHLFLEVKYKYVYNILYGLEDAWKEKKSFNWGKLFNFSKEYITKENFLEEGKKEQGEDWHPYHIWIINVVADLIQEGTRSDSWAFPEDYFKQAEEIINILLDILEKLPKKEEITHRNFVTEALNTSYGRVIIAIILFSLRKAWVKDKKGIKKEIKWESTQYDNLLSKGIIEAFTLFGEYMPDFVYLNKPWVEQKIKEFESFYPDNIKWQAFMEGYLYGYRVYQDLYKLMRNHYIKAIDSDFGEERTENRLVQHITIGYLRGNESLESKESLFKKIIDKWNYTQLNEIVDFLWNQGRSMTEQDKETEEDKEIKERIIKFWEWTYEKRDIIKDRLKENYGKFLAALSKLTVLLDKIDDTNSKWLLLSAPYAGQSFDSTFFIEYLDKLANKDKRNIKYIADIFLEMLSKSTPTFREENIKSIVENIYQFGNKNKANTICNIYGSRGHEFLRPLYEKYNPIF